MCKLVLNRPKKSLKSFFSSNLTHQTSTDCYLDVWIIFNFQGRFCPKTVFFFKNLKCKSSRNAVISNEWNIVNKHTFISWLILPPPPPSPGDRGSRTVFLLLQGYFVGWLNQSVHLFTCDLISMWLGKKKTFKGWSHPTVICLITIPDTCVLGRNWWSAYRRTWTAYFIHPLWPINCFDFMKYQYFPFWTWYGRTWWGGPSGQYGEN